MYMKVVFLITLGMDEILDAFTHVYLTNFQQLCNHSVSCIGMISDFPGCAIFLLL